MKKITFTLTMLMLALFLHAQNYDEIKQNVMLNQYKKAKEDLDKKMSNAKFASKPEAYILKSTIYAAMAADSVEASTRPVIRSRAPLANSISTMPGGAARSVCPTTSPAGAPLGCTVPLRAWRRQRCSRFG